MCITWNGYFKHHMFFPSWGLDLKLAHFLPEILIRTGSFSSPVFHGVWGFLFALHRTTSISIALRVNFVILHQTPRRARSYMHLKFSSSFYLSDFHPLLNRSASYLGVIPLIFFFYKPLPGVNDSNYPLGWILHHWKQPWLGISLLGLVTKGN